MDSPRLRWIKRHAVKTHHAPEMIETPWMAILPLIDDLHKSVADIMSESCRLYDEAALVGYGTTEDEAIYDLAVNSGTPLWNEETPQ